MALQRTRFLARGRNTSQPLQHPLRLIGDGVHGGGLIADLVEARLHGLDELLLGLVRAVLVARVVDIDEDGFDVVGLVDSAVRIDAGYADELEEVEQHGLDKALEVERTVAVRIGGRAVGGGREAHDAGFFESRELVFKLEEE